MRLHSCSLALSRPERRRMPRELRTRDVAVDTSAIDFSGRACSRSGSESQTYFKGSWRSQIH